MKTEEEVRERVRELVEGDLRRRTEAAQVKLPHLCGHNYRDPLDRRKMILDEPNDRYNRIQDARHLPLAQTIGLCMLGSKDPEQWAGDICDDPIDAERCPYFKPRQSSDDVETEFYDNLRNPLWVTENLPAVAALLWVSGASELPVAPEPTPVPEVPPAEMPLMVAEVEQPQPWWRRVWRRVFG